MPKELTAKTAPSGACAARACRVMPYRSVSNRSTSSTGTLVPLLGLLRGLPSVRTRSNLVKRSATGLPRVPSQRPVDVAFEQVFNLLLATPARGRLG